VDLNRDNKALQAALNGPAKKIFRGKARKKSRAIPMADQGPHSCDLPTERGEMLGGVAKNKMKRQSPWNPELAQSAKKTKKSGRITKRRGGGSSNARGGGDQGLGKGKGQREVKKRGRPNPFQIRAARTFRVNQKKTQRWFPPRKKPDARPRYQKARGGKYTQLTKENYPRLKGQGI